MEPRFASVLSHVPVSAGNVGIATQSLRIGAVDDPSEHEADRVADRIVGKQPALREGASSSITPRPFDFSQVRVHRGPEAVESAQSINALAYTMGNHVVMGQAPSMSSAAGQRLLAHELTHVIQQNSGADGTVVRRFTPFEKLQQDAGDSMGWKHPAGDKLRVSDDGMMAAEDKGWGAGLSQRAWTKPEKVAESNKILDGQSSRARLRAKGGGQDISGQAPASGSASTLQEIEPINADGGPINLASDCGSACRQIMGSGNTDAAVVKKDNGTAGALIGGGIGLAALGAAGAGIGYAAGGSSHRCLGAAIGAAVGGGLGLIGGILTGRAIGKSSSSEETLTPREYHGGNPTTPQEWSLELFKKEFGQNLSDEQALAAYNNLSPDDKDAFDRKYGINQYAVPRVGQGITMSTESNMPGFQPESAHTWNFHYAANVLSSGSDYITLESAAGWGPDDWIFFMYGPASKAESFYEFHRDTLTHGNKNTAMVVQSAK